MKALMPDFAGNRQLRQRLGSEILSGKLSHAYIIEGAHGTGRHTLARLIAASLACEGKTDGSLPLPCHRCEACRKIFGGISPDIITVGCGEGKASVGVDKIRYIRGDASTLPNDLDIKVYIIENADKLTVQAQNAFLLTLEEPPSFVLMLLLCEHADLLLETIRSRAPVLRVRPVDNDEIDGFLADNQDACQLKRRNPDEYAEIIAAGAGSIGTVLTLLDAEKRAPVLAARAHAREFVALCVCRTDARALLDAVAGFPTVRGEVIERLSLISLALRDLLVLKKDENAPLCFYRDRESASALADGITAVSLFELADACDSARDAAARNGNIRLILLDFTLNAYRLR